MKQKIKNTLKSFEFHLYFIAPLLGFIIARIYIYFNK